MRQDPVVREQSLFGVKGKGRRMDNEANVRYQNQKAEIKTQALWLSQS